VNRREIIQQFIPSSPLVRHLGLRLESIGDDEATLVLPFRPELATMDDVVHGGAIASLIDTAGMASCWAADEEPESLAGSTVTMNVNYVAAARGKDLAAHAVVVRRGRSLVFSEVKVTEPDGRLVATGSVVQRLGT
jgi:uncharacterized protein (TIGR00369 family)